MFRKAINTEARRSAIPVVGIGVVLAIFVSIICAMIISYMAISGILDEEKIKYAVMACIFLSSFICGLIVFTKVTNQKAVMALLAVVIYNVIMICTGMLFFESAFQSPIINCVVSLVGGVTSIVLLLVFPQNPRRAKIHSR